MGVFRLRLWELEKSLSSIGVGTHFFVIPYPSFALPSRGWYDMKLGLLFNFSPSRSIESTRGLKLYKASCELNPRSPDRSLISWSTDLD